MLVVVEVPYGHQQTMCAEATRVARPLAEVQLIARRQPRHRGQQPLLWLGPHPAQMGLSPESTQ
jgi:hypothetical protein